ncbi:hypothetical protein ATY81_22080 [Rhizobium sp. R72]|nr:hypothetical protein ATY81_22080 [Rhizobium sp. R72]OWW02471.1 hypothetical protein ATY80_22080 [Rhizobium sp. R711]
MMLLMLVHLNGQDVNLTVFAARAGRLSHERSSDRQKPAGDTGGRLFEIGSADIRVRTTPR